MCERRTRYVFTQGIVLALICSGAAHGCAEQPEEAHEIIGNLVKAGFPADDIMVVEGSVYVGRDAQVSLAASREMLLDSSTGKEQYRTTNTIGTAVTKICIDGTTFTGMFSTALDLAIKNYDEQPLSFAMARTPSIGCNATITAVIQPGLVGGVSGFPSGGLPFGTINIGGGLSTFSVDTIEHVITHEIGHTIGFRHSDFFNRAISCGGSAVNEGDAGIGAILIPGTPNDATVGGSVMNSCFRTIETGEFTATDVTALKALYTPTQGNWRWCDKCQGMFFAGNGSSVCPAGGTHEAGVSFNYRLLHEVAPDPDLQGNWRWCHKCQGMFFAGNGSSRCPAGGTHEAGVSFNYSLFHEVGFGPGLQDNWRWCHKCQGLFFAGNGGSVCPAGGAHEASVSFDYSLNF
jgi:Dual-action HEIGH metallo-peptidase